MTPHTCKNFFLAALLLAIATSSPAASAPASQPVDPVAILPTLVPDASFASQPASSPASSPAASAPNWMANIGEPGEFTKNVLPKLLESRPELGLRVAELPGEIREILGTRFDWGKGLAPAGGLLVSRMLEKFDALAVGVVEGDILTGIDFGEGGIQPLGSLEDLDLAMEQIKPGQVVRLMLFRRGQIAKADVQVGEWNSLLEPVAEGVSSRFEEPWTTFNPPWLEVERLECLKAWRLKKDLMALKDRADLSLLCGDYAHAAEDYKELLEAWPTQPKPHPAYLGRSLALRKCGKYAQAEEAAREVLKLQPNCYWAHLELARCARAKGNPKEAVRQLKLAWTKIPANDLAGIDEAWALWVGEYFSEWEERE